MNSPQPNKRQNPTILHPEVDGLLELPERGPLPVAGPDRPSAAAAAWGAVRRHPWHALIPLVACLIVAFVLTTFRSPEYTAEAQLGISRIDVSTYSIPGFVSASRELAASYSRALKTSAVTRPLARDLGIRPAEVSSRLSASPIPESAVIVVTAKGSSEREAVELANAAKTALIAYVTRLNRSNPDSARLLSAFERASLELRTARGARADALSAKASDRQETLDQLNARIAKAKLEVKTLNGLYRASQQGQAATDVIQVLSPATSARSDAGAFLQRLLFVGLLAGLFAGVGVALLRANRDRSAHAWP
jgi:capsular polysaccharide biosynthesis protein